MRTGRASREDGPTVDGREPAGHHVVLVGTGPAEEARRPGEGEPEGLGISGCAMYDSFSFGDDHRRSRLRHGGGDGPR